MKTNYIFFVLTIFIFLAFSCKNKNPQIPSNRPDEVLSVFEMEEFNRRLVEREDTIIQRYIAGKNETFIKDNKGFWYKITTHTEGEEIKEGCVLIISYKMFLLNDGLVDEEEDREITVGKNEIIKGLDMGLMLLRKGESATFIFPFNLAYGILGDRINIPGYASIIMEIDTEP